MSGTDSHGNNAGGNYARYIGLGFTFVFILGLLAGLGLYVDKLLGTLPLFLLLGLGLGFAGSLYYVYLALKNLGDG